MLLNLRRDTQNLLLNSSKILFISKAIFLSILIAISAQISIPFWPVPLTLQPMAILAIGFSCTPALALASVIAYILEGAIGFPVFQGLTGGFPHLLGARGGYIIGFLPLAFLSSYFKGSHPTFGHLFKIGLIAYIPLFSLGVLWLSSFLGMNNALNLGLWPFMLKVPVEIAFAIITSQLTQKFSHSLFHRP